MEPLKAKGRRDHSHAKRPPLQLICPCLIGRKDLKPFHPSGIAAEHPSQLK